jgi:hypothetical protein
MALIARLAEYLSKDEADKLPPKRQGIYALFRKRASAYDVVYVGLSIKGIRARLRAHRRDRKKTKVWTHFSVFEVTAGTTPEQIAELEGLFRQIYRRDTQANRLNVQRTHGPLRRLRQNDLSTWNVEAPTPSRGERRGAQSLSGTSADGNSDIVSKPAGQ